LSVLTEKSLGGEYIIDWERTNLTKFFSAIIRETKSKGASLQSECPVYKQYLNMIGFDEYIFEEKRFHFYLS